MGRTKKVKTKDSSATTSSTTQSTAGASNQQRETRRSSRLQVQQPEPNTETATTVQRRRAASDLTVAPPAKKTKVAKPKGHGRQPVPLQEDDFSFETVPPPPPARIKTKNLNRQVQSISDDDNSDDDSPVLPPPRLKSKTQTVTQTRTRNKIPQAGDANADDADDDADEDADDDDDPPRPPPREVRKNSKLAAKPILQDFENVDGKGSVGTKAKRMGRVPDVHELDREENDSRSEHDDASHSGDDEQEYPEYDIDSDDLASERPSVSSKKATTYQHRSQKDEDEEEHDGDEQGNDDDEHQSNNAEGDDENEQRAGDDILDVDMDVDDEPAPRRKTKKSTVQDARYNDEIPRIVVPADANSNVGKTSKKGKKRQDDESTAPDSALVIALAKDIRNKDWPPSTHIKWPESGKSHFSKLAQPTVMKNVLNRASKILLGLFLFHKAFPSPLELEAMAKRAVLQAVADYKQPEIQTRFEEDDQYKKILSTTTSDSATHIRGELQRRVSIQMVLEWYDLNTIKNPEDRSSAARKIGTSLFYTHPMFNVRVPSVSYDKSKPYRHEAISNVISIAFAKGDKPAFEVYQTNFNAPENKPDEFEVPKSMVALAATIIWSRLNDIASASDVSSAFSYKLCRNEYDHNIKYLTTIEDGLKSKKRGNEFHKLLHKLYKNILVGNDLVKELPEVDYEAMVISD